MLGGGENQACDQCGIPVRWKARSIMACSSLRRCPIQLPWILLGGWTTSAEDPDTIPLLRSFSTSRLPFLAPCPAAPEGLMPDDSLSDGQVLRLEEVV